MKANIVTLIVFGIAAVTLCCRCPAEEPPGNLLTALNSTTISGYVDTVAHFNAPMPGDENWQSGFVLPPGVDGEVLAIASIGNNVYVGGRFVLAGDLVVNGIARWDGTNWHSVGGGVHGVGVAAFAVSGTNLYVGGTFDGAGNIAATNLACWTGTEWRSIGNVTGRDSYSFQEPNVAALLFTNGELFAAGSFREISGVAATNIAKWDGTNWSALGSGIGSKGGSIFALAKFGSQLYAGGRFFDDVGATNIARWNGKTWLALGKGIRDGAAAYRIDNNEYSGEVNGLAVSHGTLWVGGNFASAGNLHVANLARWTGRHWSRAGAGVGSARTSAVSRMFARGREMYITGSFEQVNGVGATNIARWNGRRWKPIAGGVNGHGLSIGFADNGDLFLGGDFGVASGTSAANVARWNGANWSALGEGQGNTIMGYPTTIAAVGERIYVAGLLHTAGTNSVKNVACWNGTNWSSLGNGIPVGSVSASAVSGSNYYVAGAFEIPEVGATNVVCWNGLQWQALSSGVRFGDSPGSISCIAADENLVYVGGYFTSAGGVLATNIAVWNGTNWSAIGSLRYAGGAPVVNALAARNGKLYAAGIFGIPGYEDFVMQWDGAGWGSRWSRGFQPGYSPFVRSVAFARDDLFAWGSFTNAPGITATNLAKWNGENWSDVGQPFDSPALITSVAATTNFVYVGGSFTNAAGVAAISIARYDGMNWLALGRGIEGDGNAGLVQSLVTSGKQVFITGLFKTAGGKPSYRFAVWNEPD